jgi:hypothetical protein
MAKFLMDETIHSEKVTTSRLGGTGAAKFTDAENGKAVKLGAESQYDLTADGNSIEGFVSSISSGPTYDGFALGGVVSTGTKRVLVSGATVAVGDYVVSAAPVALGTKLATYAPVKKAADQAIAAAAPFKWRVVSRGSAGTGVAGTTVLIERV